MSTHLTPAQALAALAGNTDGTPFKELFKHGSLAVEVYRPIGVDHQSVHDRDEAYVVIAGRGTFLCGDLRLPFGPGDFLFVAAGMAHRFENFSDDFSTWVLFYGPHGGEEA
jgi:mannose-6-phosphate isomerase-like protein (cupin superfamily)